MGNARRAERIGPDSYQNEFIVMLEKHFNLKFTLLQGNILAATNTDLSSFDGIL